MLPRGPRTLTFWPAESTATTSATTVDSFATAPPGRCPASARPASVRVTMLAGAPVPPFLSSSVSASMKSTVTVSPTLSCGRLRTSGPATVVNVVPSARRSVTWRVAMSIDVTVAVAEIVRTPAATPGAVPKTAPPLTWAWVGTAITAASTAAATGSRLCLFIFDSSVGNQGTLPPVGGDLPT